jgi:uncharacterized protein
VFGWRDVLGKFVRFVAARMRPDRHYRIGIGHANAEERARELLERLTQVRPGIESSFVMPVGSALSVHGGPGTLVVGIQERSEKRIADSG